MNEVEQIYVGKALPILKYPDPRLLEPSFVVDDFGSDLQHLIADMRATASKVRWGKAVGLSAVQIGAHLRVALVLGDVMINPEVTWRSNEIRNQREGCYSLTDNKFDYPTRRHRTIEVTWFDECGRLCKKRFKGFDAIVVQHELDHLDGKLCYNNNSTS